MKPNIPNQIPYKQNENRNTSNEVAQITQKKKYKGPDKQVQRERRRLKCETQKREAQQHGESGKRRVEGEDDFVKNAKRKIASKSLITVAIV
jgi:hypothetical protein